MKLSLNWLKDYVDPKLTTDELVERLTMAGLEVEEVKSVGGDTVLDLEITPNRPDCLNIIGLAREISAITSKNLKLPKIKSYKTTKKNLFSVIVEDKKDCLLYSASLIENVNIAASEGEIKECTNALGISSVNNAVDITNFVLMEQGQPLHAFDFDKVEGGTIIVRRAKKGESIVSLDGVERKLDPSILVIADTKKPIAIAGIMGGKGTEITAATKNILLESAHFDMGLVRKASRSLGLKSDSSYRFERGVCIDGVLNGANRAIDLLCSSTKGSFTGRVEIKRSGKLKLIHILISVLDIETLLGTKVTAPQVKNTLTRLGLKVAAGKKGKFKVTIPSFRGDLRQGVDLIEEVARVIGYDRLEVSFPRIQVLNIAPNARPRQVRKVISDTLLSQGYDEAVTFSLISQKDLKSSNLENAPVIQLHNFLSAEHCLLRPSMMPSLLQVAMTNFNRGQKDLRLFEMGKRYFLNGERSTLGILATGKKNVQWQNNSKERVNFFDVKGALELLLNRIGAQVHFEAGNYPGLEANTTSLMKRDGKTVGAVGKIEKTVLQQWDIKASDIFFAELDVQALYEIPKDTLKYQPISEFPSIVRDVSIAVKKEIAFKQVKDVCLKFGGNILKNVYLIEEYVGDKIQAGHRGLVFTLLYQSQERTLREEEVNAAHYNILKNLTHDCGAIQR